MAPAPAATAAAAPAPAATAAAAPAPAAAPAATGAPATGLSSSSGRPGSSSPRSHEASRPLRSGAGGAAVSAVCAGLVPAAPGSPGPAGPRSCPVPLLPGPAPARPRSCPVPLLPGPAPARPRSSRSRSCPAPLLPVPAMPGCRCPLPALPLLRWLPRYSRAWLPLDALAGLAVGLTAVPQALAYAELAGLPLQYGLYSSFMGCFVYCFLGTAKDVTLGPTAIMSLLVSSYAFHEPVHAVLLAFLSGCIQLAMGLLRFGFLLDFISCPVIKGFTSAASITISFNQIKNILGLQGIPRQFFLQVYETLRRIGETRAGDAVLGLTCLAALAGLRAMKSRLPPAAPADPLAVRISYLIVWISATGVSAVPWPGPSRGLISSPGWQEPRPGARNALVVLFAGLVAYSFQVMGSQPFRLTGSIPRGLPAFRPPRFSLAAPNGTVPFQSMVQDMGAGLAVVPLMGLLETIAIAKAFASQNGYRIDPDQELLALGVANVLGSFVSSYPITGSFGRAGPFAPLCDIPALLLGDSVRNRGGGAAFWDPPALLHCQAPNKGVGGGGAAGAAGERPALPRRGAPAGLGVQPCSGSISTTLRHPGLLPHQQHRLHGGGGAGRAAAGAARARPLAGLLWPEGPCSPSPAVCRLRRIPAFPQLGGGSAVQGSGALHQHCRQLGAHPVRRVWVERPVTPQGPQHTAWEPPAAARPVGMDCPHVPHRDGQSGTSPAPHGLWDKTVPCHSDQCKAILPPWLLPFLNSCLNSGPFSCPGPLQW
ncbi:sodium-independent sulfate anion transporter isoform X2 [Prinia subflava]|uniref:sodium-independent sulfate anion transporter isoform X2 n=1 Tax=Prinia subflava TaxID=208062 RepID=UPI002FE0115A